MQATTTLFRDDAYLRRCEATVISTGEEGIVLDQTVFYPLGGGQPGFVEDDAMEAATVRFVMPE